MGVVRAFVASKIGVGVLGLDATANERRRLVIVLWLEAFVARPRLD
jgi:hypothetical protein